MGNPVASRGGWLSDRSWDFCSDGSWYPIPEGDRAPRIPTLLTQQVPDPLVTSLLGSPPPRSVAAQRAAAAGLRPVAPSLRPARIARQQRADPPPNLPKRSCNPRLSSFFPELPWDSTDALH